MYIRHLDHYLDRLPPRLWPLLRNFSSLLTRIDPEQSWDQTLFDELVNREGNPMTSFRSDFGFNLKGDLCGLRYEDYVMHHRRIPFRTQDAHDFFHALCWYRWPNTKVALFHAHWEEGPQRNARRDALTLLDECGVVLVAEDSSHLSALRAMDWHALFVDGHRAWLADHIQLFVVGHALFEQACRPYIGWCVKALPLQVDSMWKWQERSAQCQQVDAWLCAQVQDALRHPQELFPLPILGIPGFWECQDEGFYRNKNYFRQKGVPKKV